MRGDWNHVEPDTTQERPEDNTSSFIREQVNVWMTESKLIHPESAMEIAAWYHGPDWPGLTAFSHTGTITNTLLSEIDEDLSIYHDTATQSELLALKAYVRAVTHADGEELIKVVWNPSEHTWAVSARASADAGWSVFDGAEDQLDTLLSLARDVATGG